MWGLAIYEERWVEVGPLKLRDIPSSVSRRGHLAVYKGIFRTRAASRAANPAPWLSMEVKAGIRSFSYLLIRVSCSPETEDALRSVKKQEK